jgi:hypothetical protein
MEKEHKPWCFKIGPLSIHNKEQWDIELVTISPQPNLIPLLCVHWKWKNNQRRLFLVF